MSPALIVMLVVGAAVAYAVRLPPASTGIVAWLALALPYGGLAALSLYRLRREGRLGAVFRLRPGDLSLGVGLGVLIALAGWALSGWLLPPDTAPRAWLSGVVLLLGGAASPMLTGGLLVIALCEEVVWRGWVQTELGLRLGSRRGWIVAAVAYSASHAPTLWTLGDPVAGPNPLVILGALGSGLCWAFLRERTGRLLPGAFAHAVALYLATQYLWRLS